MADSWTDRERMMDHAAAFLRAIREAPDDDTPRLVFADWLEERGDPRGEFIRAQCRLAQMSADHPARLDVEDHAQELLARHGDEWADPLHGVAEDWEFRRGFVERITLPDQAFLAHAERVFAAEPIRHVHLSLRPKDASALAACPELRWLETLAFGRCHLRDKAFQAILASPYLTRLTALVVPAGVEVLGVQALTESPVLSRLTHLDFSQNRAFGDRAARLLAAAPAVKKLQVLRLAGTNLTCAGMQALLESPHLSHLTTLDMAGVENMGRLWYNNRRFLLRLANSLLLARLTSLTLGQNWLDAPGVRELMGSPSLAGLRELHLHETALDPDALRLLAESEHLAGLTLLDVGGNNIRGEGLQALAESPHLANLTVLRLGNNVLRDSGAKALAASPYLKQLATLDLSNNGIGGTGLQALAASERLAGLTDLNLSGNFVGLASVQALARSAHLTRLTRLDMSSTRFEPGGARVLVESPNLARLRTLSLSDNQLGNEGAAALAASPHLARLATLRLDNNGIGKNGAEALADSPYLGRLLKLELRGNAFTDDERQRLRARFGSRVVF